MLDHSRQPASPPSAPRTRPPSMRLLRRTCFLVTLWATAVTPLTAQSAPTLDERLVRLEEGQKALAQRSDDTNQRIDDLRADMNSRFTDMRVDMNSRFDDLLFWIQMLFGLVAVVIAGLVAQWLLIWQRLIRLETTVHDQLQVTQRDQLVVQLRQELVTIAQRLEHLEGGRT